MIIKKTKKIVCILIATAFILSSLCVRSFADAQEYSWYIKRNKCKPPTFPAEAEKMEEYNAFYIDPHVDSENKKIYLTFDAGYENGNVEKIINVLREEKVTAAFFVLDNIILKNTDLVKRMVEEGHLVCNHTKNHKNLSRSTDNEIERNLLALEKIYEEKTGRELSKFFRFPEGRYSMNSLKCVNALGYKTVFWSFAYDDWDNNRQQQPQKAIKKVLENTHNGAIMLFHPTSATNAEIFPELIKEWRRQGYSFGSLEELYY